MPFHNKILLDERGDVEKLVGSTLIQTPHGLWIKTVSLVKKEIRKSCSK